MDEEELELVTPDYLFYTDNTNAVQYSRTQRQGASMHVSRLVNGAPYWETHNNQSSALRKKTLVLSDWSICDWDDELLKHTTDCLTALIEKGFLLYLWQGDHIEPLTADSLWLSLRSRHIIKQIFPAGTTSVKQMMIQQYPDGMSAENILVLDYCGLRHLLRDNQLTQGYIAIDPTHRQLDHITKGHVDSLRDSFFHLEAILIAKIEPSRSSLSIKKNVGLLSTFDPEGAPQVKGRSAAILAQQFPDARLITAPQINRTCFSRGLYPIDTGTYETASLLNYAFRDTHPTSPNSQIKTWEELSQTLITNPRIRALILGNPRRMPTENLNVFSFKWAEMNSSTLKKLTYFEITIDGTKNIEILVAILKHSTRLQSLKIAFNSRKDYFDCSNLLIQMIEQLPSSLPLLSIEINVVLRDGAHLSTIENAFIRQLFIKSPYLKMLHIDWPNHNKPPTYCFFDLTWLRENTTALQKLAAIDEGTLRYFNCDLTTRATRLTKTMFSSKIFLASDLDKDSMTASLCQNLYISNTTLPEMLRYKKILAMLDDNPDYLSQLRKLEITGSYAMPQSQTVKMIARFSRLTVFKDIGNALEQRPYLRAEWLRNHEGVFLNIEEINVNMCGCSLEDLIELLQHIPNATKITLCNFVTSSATENRHSGNTTSSNELQMDEATPLPFLETLILNNCHIDNNLFRRLIVAAPNLVRLTAGCNKMSHVTRPPLSQHHFQLPYLNTLHINIDIMPAGSLKHLLINAPDLKVLVIQSMGLREVEEVRADAFITNEEISDLESMKMFPSLTCVTFTSIGKAGNNFFALMRIIITKATRIEHLTFVLPNYSAIAIVREFILPSARESSKFLEHITCDTRLFAPLGENHDVYSVRRVIYDEQETISPKLAGNIHLDIYLAYDLMSLFDKNCRKTLTYMLEEQNNTVMEQVAGNIASRGKAKTPHTPSPNGKAKTHHPHGQRSTIDADTALHKDKRLQATTLFWTISGEAVAPNYYRLSVNTRCEVNKNVLGPQQLPFIVSEPTLAELDLAPPEYTINICPKLTTEKENSTHTARCTLDVNQQWQPLPSLSPSEIITDMQLSYPAIAILYSNTTNQYYVRNIQVGTVSVDFSYLLSVPATHKPQPSTPLAKKVSDFNQFGSGKLTLPVNPTGQDVLQAIVMQRVGACRHRAAAFMVTEFPNATKHFVISTVHAYIELYDSNTHTWIQCDLGGYHCQIDICHPVTHTNKQQSLGPQQRTSATITDSQKNGTTHSDKPSKKPSVSTAQHHKTKAISENPSEEHSSMASQPMPLSMFLADQLTTHSKSLLRVSSSVDADAMMLLLQQQAQSSWIPIFMVDHPDDLICATTWIDKNDDNTGTIKPGPGGQLYNFLQRNQEQCVLVINWSQFKPEDIVRVNSMFDSPASIDGTPLPPTVRIIGVSTPDTYSESDFLGRIGLDNITEVPFPSAELLSTAQPLSTNARIQPSTPEALNESLQFCEIELYNRHDWQNALLGAWQLEGQELIFKDGLLATALDSGQTHFEIRNGPWHLKAFRLFWQRLLITNELPLPSGDRIAIMQGIQCQHGAGFNLSNPPKLEALDTDTPFDGVINPSCFLRYFEQYQYRNEQLHAEPGRLDAFETKPLKLLLTRPLNDGQYARLLDRCNELHITLTLIVPPAIATDLPEEWHVPPAQPSSLVFIGHLNDMPSPVTFRQATQVIATSDTAYTLDQLQQHTPDAITIPITELSFCDLWEKIDGEHQTEQQRFHFSQQIGALQTALRNGRTVILAGDFSAELADEISTLYLEKQNNGITGKLILVSNGTYNPFHGIRCQIERPSRRELENSLAERFIPLLTTGKNNVPLPEFETTLQQCDPTTSYPRAKTRFRQITSGNTIGDWSAFDRLPPQTATNTAQELDLTRCPPVDQQRFTAVKTVLQQVPYIFIGGSTGSGKSTFVHQVLRPQCAALYTGEDNIHAWAEDQQEGLKVLFIDEANMTEKQWTEFEGLFYTPPQILIGKTCYPLTSQHKVVFAGNPSSYGNGRSTAALFNNHGASIIFEPLPPAYLYHRTLLPILSIAIEDKALCMNIAQTLLRVYQYVDDLSEQRVLITPRELQMMALQVCTDANTRDLRLSASCHAYSIAHHVLSAQQQNAFTTWFVQNQESRINEQLAERAMQQLQTHPLPNGYVLTDHRRLAYSQVTDGLNVRQLKLDAPSQFAQSGGLGGYIIEGEPGMGKSAFVHVTLQSQGFTLITIEILLNTKSPADIPPNTYCQIPSSLNNKEAALLAAFQAGIVVVIDEINSFSMPERLLNDLLMGVHERRPAKKLGFMLIGTQNPVTMAGRRACSPAIQRRTQHMVFPSYTKEESIQILCRKGLDQTTAEKIYHAYLQQLRQATRNHKGVTATFRDLLQQADKIIGKQGREVTQRNQSSATSCRLGTTASSHNTGQNTSQSRQEQKQASPPVEKARENINSTPTLFNDFVILENYFRSPDPNTKNKISVRPPVKVKSRTAPNCTIS